VRFVFRSVLRAPYPFDTFSPIICLATFSVLLLRVFSEKSNKKSAAIKYSARFSVIYQWNQTYTYARPGVK
jgi:hypothetical protein